MKNKCPKYHCSPPFCAYLKGVISGDKELAHYIKREKEAIDLYEVKMWAFFMKDIKPLITEYVELSGVDAPAETPAETAVEKKRAASANAASMRKAMIPESIRAIRDTCKLRILVAETRAKRSIDYFIRGTAFLRNKGATFASDHEIKASGLGAAFVKNIVEERGIHYENQGL